MWGTSLRFTASSAIRRTVHRAHPSGGSLQTIAMIRCFWLASNVTIAPGCCLSCSRADTGDSEFYRLAGELYRGEKTLPDATQTVESRTTKNFSAEKAAGRMRELFQDGDGFYGWDGLRYFLFEYEQHLKDKAGMGTIKLTWSEFNSSKRDRVTIEHIYPKRQFMGSGHRLRPGLTTNVEFFAIHLGIFLPHRRAGMQSFLTGLSRRRSRTQKAKRAISAGLIARSRWRSCRIGHLKLCSTVGSRCSIFLSHVGLSLSVRMMTR